MERASGRVQGSAAPGDDLAHEKWEKVIKQVMLIIHEAETLKLVGNMLERGGFSVLESESVKVALDTLNVFTPDLVIVDAEMPDGQGIELCGQLRARQDTARTPVIAVSRLDEPDKITQMLEAGANEFLAKPILEYDFLHMVRAVLDRGEPRKS